MAMQTVRDLFSWWANLPLDMAFLFSLPFMVAVAGLLAHTLWHKRRSPR
jgi:hypothetical protein